MKNALTIDLEDWYHICGEGEHTDPARWGDYESRVARNTDIILDTLGRTSSKATFFVLGYIAEQNPSLIKKIFKQGHELAVHGYYHRRVYEMTEQEFDEDLRKSIDVVEGITGAKVHGFRAPEWSIRRSTGWALDIMKKQGLSYDSSTVPLTGMGERSFKRFPHVVDTAYGELHEFPLTTFKCLWENLPYTGGLPLRLAPYWFVLEGIKRLNRAGRPAMVYLHPWEFDRAQPKIELPLARRFMHYFNIGSTRPKFEGLLKYLEFASIKDILNI